MNEFQQKFLRAIADGDASCMNCMFFRGPKPKDNTIGWCHRHAPKPHVEGEYTYWPEVKTNLWCGEWISCVAFDGYDSIDGDADA